MKVAICPGSFDPITLGHLDIIKRAAKMFDKVIVGVLKNSAKNPVFTIEERMDFLRLTTEKIGNIEIDTFSGLLADYAKEKNAHVIVKGLRALSDFEYEFQMALMNKKLNKNLETVYLNTSSKYMFLSSSVVKEIGRHGGDISGFVPPQVHDVIIKRLRKGE